MLSVGLLVLLCFDRSAPAQESAATLLQLLTSAAFGSVALTSTIQSFFPPTRLASQHASLTAYSGTLGSACAVLQALLPPSRACVVETAFGNRTSLLRLLTWAHTTPALVCLTALVGDAPKAEFVAAVWDDEGALLPSSQTTHVSNVALSSTTHHFPLFVPQA